MAVTEILKSVKRIWLRLIIPVGGARNHGLRIKQEPHITAQVNRGRRVNSSWKPHCTTATAAALFNGGIDGRGIIIHSVTACAKIAHVELRGTERRNLHRRDRQSSRQDQERQAVYHLISISRTRFCMRTFLKALRILSPKPAFIGTASSKRKGVEMSDVLTCTFSKPHIRDQNGCRVSKSLTR